MTSKQPAIKFSPFEALLIGEKNRILKRQPMKNTIFVTRLNKKRKTINLRDLFGLESNKKTDDGDGIFKMPQRVCEFLKNKRLQNKASKQKNKEQGEVLCYEFEGCKMITNSSENVAIKGKNKKEKLSRVKFKRKYKCKDNFKNKVVKKFPSPIRKRHYYRTKAKCLVVKSKKRSYNGQRHLLRGKDGKFICKHEFERLNSKDIPAKDKHLSNSFHRLCVDKNQHFSNPSDLNKDSSSKELKTSFSIESVDLLNFQFDAPAGETMLDEYCRKFYESGCHENFKFPEFPKQLKPLDFENDRNLVDIIYENFPAILKFESKTHIDDFTDALLNTEILKPEKNVKMYEKKKNGFMKDEDIREILGRGFPLIRLERMKNIMPHQYPNKNERSAYASKIDEPYTKKSHLITAKSFGSFFFRSAEGKDIFIGNLMKPFLQNSWFGSLPEV